MNAGSLADRDAVTFDCWATLIFEADWPAAHRIRVAALRDAVRESGRDLSSHEAGAIFDAAWGKHMKLWREGVATGARDIASWVLADLQIQQQLSLAHLVQHFEEASHSGRVLALPGAQNTLARLHAAGVKCSLVCDTGLTPGRVVRKHLDRLGLLGLLDSLAFSDEVGVPKPDPRIFRAALDPLGVQPERAVHVGDLRATDVVGGRELGMATVRIRAHHDDPSPLPDGDFVVDSHEQLSQLLSKQPG
jgi:putative hydrolase of the HAD superfamily